MSRKSLNLVEEMNTDTYRVFELIRQPILIAFVDMKSADKTEARNSIKLVDEVLPEIAPSFYHGVIFSYADNNVYREHRKLLGITHSR